MSGERTDAADRARALDLLAERAIFGLEGEDSLELDRLLLSHPDLDDDRVDLLVASLSMLPLGADSSAVATGHESSPEMASSAAISATMPAALHERMVTLGESWVRSRSVVRLGSGATDAATRSSRRSTALAPGGPSRELRNGTVAAVGAGRADVSARPSPSTDRRKGLVWLAGAAFLGWSAAAAAVVLAIAAWFPAFSSRQTIAAQRAELIAKATDLIQVEWDPSEHGLIDSCVSGSVVWSTDQQRGYLAIGGLRPNDPSQFQYQLWIFDQTRDAAFPVDGGVFDVPEISPGGIALIPVKPRLLVREAILFAVTVEPPGGVVVSKRDIALLAKASPR